MKSTNPQPVANSKEWFVVDADGQTLGRLASRIASVLRGKHKPTFSTSVDMGDFVIVLNAGKVVVSGNKLIDKVYHRHTGYPGGIRSISLEKLLQEKPTEAITKAVKGMMPDGVLGTAQLRKLKVYADANHPHEAQMPKELSL